MTDLTPCTNAAAPYGRFAAAYAAGAERGFSEDMAGFALATSNTGTRPTSVVDVACGIGAACERFAAAGLRTVGVDASDDMLNHARNSAEAVGLKIDYLRQDMRELSLPTKVDLVTCMYDSLNFMLAAADLIQAFEAALRALSDGGRYVFDMYTPLGLANVWASVDEIHTALPDHFVATRTVWNETDCTNTKTLWGFDLSNTDWRHWTERHKIRAYPMEEVEGALNTAGFRLLRAADWTPPHPKPVSASTTRIVYVAQAY